MTAPKPERRRRDVSGFDAVPDLALTAADGDAAGAAFATRGGVAHPEPIDVTIELVAPLGTDPVRVTLEDGSVGHGSSRPVDVRLVLPE
ncbi:MAG: hypothetical protein ACE5GC_07065 [Acidimicrobiia bacterium]